MTDDISRCRVRSMITDKDVEKLKKTFATKDGVREDIRVFKEDLLDGMDKALEKQKQSSQLLIKLLLMLGLPIITSFICHQLFLRNQK